MNITPEGGAVLDTYEALRIARWLIAEQVERFWETLTWEDLPMLTESSMAMVMSAVESDSRLMRLSIQAHDTAARGLSSAELVERSRGERS